MSKAWILSVLIGLFALWLAASQFARHNTPFSFLADAQTVESEDIVFSKKLQAHVDAYNWHMPYDLAWGKAQLELCDKMGWRLGSHSPECQQFDSNGVWSVAIMKGKVDDRGEFIPGTESTDTYVKVRRPRG